MTCGCQFSLATDLSFRAYKLLMSSSLHLTPLWSSANLLITQGSLVLYQASEQFSNSFNYVHPKQQKVKETLSSCFASFFPLEQILPYAQNFLEVFFFFSIRGRRSVKIKRADFSRDSEAALCQVFSVFRARSSEYFLSLYMSQGEEQRGTKDESVTLVSSLKPPAEETEKGEGMNGDRSPRLSSFNPCSIMRNTHLRHT